MKIRHSVTILFISIFWSACGGHIAVPSATMSGSSSASVAIHIPEVTTSSGARVPKYVSPSTQGIAIAYAVHGSGQNSGSVNVDLSSTSSACSATTTGRTCTISVMPPVGSDDFTFTTYDVPPSSASFGTAAHELGTATVTATIASGTANTINVALGGLPKSLALVVPYSSIYGNNPATFNLGLEALDADGNIILAGLTTVTNGSSTETDTYAAPITVALSESNANAGGDTKLKLNGGSPASQVTVNNTNDVLTVVYDGLAPSTYSVSFAATASSVSPNPPAVKLTPLFVSGSGGGTFTNGSSPTLAFTVPYTTQTIALSEAGHSGPYSVGLNVGTQNCPSQALSIDTSNLSSNGSFTVSAGVLPASASGCMLTIADGNTATVNVAVSNAADPILFVPDSATTAIDEYDTVTYAVLGSFAVNNGTASSGYRPVVAALDKMFGRLWVGYDHSVPGTNLISALVQAYTASNGSFISTSPVGFGNTLVSGLTVTTSSADSLYINLPNTDVLDVYNVASNTPSAGSSISGNLEGGVFLDTINNLLYVSGDSGSGQDFVDVYNATSLAQIAADTIPQPLRTSLSIAVAVDVAHSHAYVADTATNQIYVYTLPHTAAGTIAAPSGNPGILGLAFDPRFGKLFASYTDAIRVYDTTNSNALLHTFTTSATASGMAVTPGQ